MIGLVLMCVMGVWVVIATNLYNQIMQKVRLRKYQKTLSASLFVILLSLPLLDEIIGGMHFWYLCYTEDLLIYDAENIRGRSVIYTSLPVGKISSVIPIEEFSGQWQDAKTNEVLLTRRYLRAQGGWLSRLSGFPEGSPPYVFENFCAPKEYSGLFDKYNVTKFDS